MSLKHKVVPEENWYSKLLANIDSGEVINITDILPILTPGTPLRNGLDEILFGNLGALIVIGSNDSLKDILKGGIDLDIDFTSQRVFELAKMDGAIVISNDLKKIIAANKHIMPDRNISSSETGIRHRTAEQTAIQTNLPVIAISHRRNIISLYFRDQRYILQDISLLIVKANNILQNLKDYRAQIDKKLKKLILSEFNTPKVVFDEMIVTLQDILNFFKSKKELDKFIIELGDQGTNISNSLFEITTGLKEQLKLLLMDYSYEQIDYNQASELVDYLRQLSIRQISDIENLNKIVKFNKESRGYRILYSIPKINIETISKLLDSKSLAEIRKSTPEQISLLGLLDLKTSKYLLQQLNKLNEDISEDLFNF